jgi:hypothetical protein
MIKEAIQEIAQLAERASSFDMLIESDSIYNGKSVSYVYKVDPTLHGRRIGEVISPFRPATLQVNTLTGFLDAIQAGIATPPLSDEPATPKTFSGSSAQTVPDGFLVHVENYLTVTLKSTICDQYGVRDVLLQAKHIPIDAFRFDDYYADPAKFIIALQVSFLPTEELLNLIKIASNLKAGKSIHVQDDGFSQAITVKVGEVSSAEIKIPPRIKLIPIRTFSEAAPVQSEFLIRFRQTAEETPSIALFNVDGNKWQGETMRSIKKYLGEHLKNVPILA